MGSDLDRDPSPLGSDHQRLSGLPHLRLADRLEVDRAVREALVLLGGGARAGLERAGPAFERC